VKASVTLRRQTYKRLLSSLPEGESLGRFVAYLLIEALDSTPPKRGVDVAIPPDLARIIGQKMIAQYGEYVIRYLVRSV